MALTVELPPLSVPEGLPALLRDLIHDHAGTWFDPSRFDVMLEKLTPLARARECHSWMDYYYILKYGDAAEWRNVLDALSVQETYFWREMDQIQALVKVIVPEWFKTHHTTLKIWSAACATGEEPYTIAIALQEAGLGNMPIDILATDGSCSALERARRGRYRERSFRTLPEHLREKYFTRDTESSQLDPAIMGRVRFDCRNLVSREEISTYASSDFIFCRNVFIYFTPDTIKRTVETMADYMPADGKLFVGASESLLKLTDRFDLQQIGGAFVYTRATAPGTGQGAAS